MKLWVELAFFIINFHVVSCSSQTLYWGETSEGNLMKEIMEDSDWQTWKFIHEKTYETWHAEIDSHRIWRHNLAHVLSHNQKFAAGYETYQKSLNSYSDYNPATVVGRIADSNYPDFKKKQDIAATVIPQQTVPDNADWRKKNGVLNEIRVQSVFPYGWLFAALEIVQSQMLLRIGESFPLSTQELMDCLVEYGFNQGSVLDALLYMKLRGISLETDYPLNPHKMGSCERKRVPIKLRIQSVHRVNPDDEESLKLAVAVIGPIAVNIRVTANFVAYFSGVFYDNTCSAKRRTNHAVVVVGYGTDPVAGDFWIIKNSWGPYWGEKGYMRMARNSYYNCGITKAAFYFQ